MQANKDLFVCVTCFFVALQRVRLHRLLNVNIFSGFLSLLWQESENLCSSDLLV